MAFDEDDDPIHHPPLHPRPSPLLRQAEEEEEHRATAATTTTTSRSSSPDGETPSTAGVQGMGNRKMCEYKGWAGRIGLVGNGGWAGRTRLVVPCHSGVVGLVMGA